MRKSLMCLFDKEHLAEHRLENGEIGGYEYEIVHNGNGYRCGYIKVLPGHPWFAKSYDDILADAHGGLTFARYGKACPGDHDENAEWWVGFDCAHAGDGIDYALDKYGKLDRVRAIHEQVALEMGHDFPGYNRGDHEYIKDTDYVRAQCASLTEQAIAAANS